MTLNFLRKRVNEPSPLELLEQKHVEEVSAMEANARRIAAAKDATIYELRENCYELMRDIAELETELRILKAARARGNANLIPGGPKRKAAVMAEREGV